MVLVTEPYESDERILTDSTFTSTVLYRTVQESNKKKVRYGTVPVPLRKIVIMYIFLYGTVPLFCTYDCIIINLFY